MGLNKCFFFFLAKCKMRGLQETIVMSHQIRLQRKAIRKFTYLRDLTRGISSNPLKLNLIYFKNSFAEVLN